MPETLTLFDPPPSDDTLTLGDYAERAYLDYAISVVKGRALPDVCDGQKPVQRRILYAMHELGLGDAAKPRKSAAVVGDVLGKLHPHGDQSVYDALVRMAQSFSLRYPLVDGQGNFGSRDGDGAAAMRYTEARLTPIARLLLDEIDEGTADFQPNYDGSSREPKLLPARLPFVLLNGASGIAVGLATEIPPHNLGEVARAAVAMIRSSKDLSRRGKGPDEGGVEAMDTPGSLTPALSRGEREKDGDIAEARSRNEREHNVDGGQTVRFKTTTAELLEHIQGPDFPGGGQIISSPSEIADIYESGRGSVKVRARWKIEDLARGQWQLVVTELPPNASSQKVLEEIDELTNPKVKLGKKSLSAEQLQTKQNVLALLDRVRDESGKEAAVRLVFEPKSRMVDQNELINTLLAYTSLESSSPINLVAIGIDGRPCQKTLADILGEWVTFRQSCVTRRTRHRLQKVDERIHILEGRLIVLLNIDQVIRIIRNADEPKPALIEAFALSDRQAEDILEIRLRQLARLEGIRIERELGELKVDKQSLEELLANPASMKRQLIKEIEADAKQYGAPERDPRRTLIQEQKRAVLEAKVVDEPLTVVISKMGWVRALKGHDLDADQFGFKTGDALAGIYQCRTADQLIALGTSGRAYSVPVAQLPLARAARGTVSAGEGVPVTSLIDLEPGTRVAQMFVGAADQPLLVATSSGYGFVCRVGDLVSRVKGGKAFLTLTESSPGEPEDLPLPLAPVDVGHHTHIACLASSGRLLVFPADEIKMLSGGGRGVILQEVERGETLLSAIPAGPSGLILVGTGRGGKEMSIALSGLFLEAHYGKRARKGKLGPAKLKARGLALPSGKRSSDGGSRDL